MPRNKNGGLPAIVVDTYKRFAPGELPKDPTHAGIFVERFEKMVKARGGSFAEVPYGRLHDKLLEILRQPSPDVRTLTDGWEFRREGEKACRPVRSA